MTKFFIARNMDSDEMFWKALLDAGYTEVDHPARADFIVHDAVHPNLGQYLQEKPNFITPHTPSSAWLWDGILEDRIPVCCNFVTGEAGKQVMAAYDYPYRVEVVGFNRCHMHAFHPTTGNDLLIIPSHSLQNRQYTYLNYREWVVMVLRFVLANRSIFGKITLCWDEDRFDPTLMDDMKHSGFTIIPTNPYRDPEPLKHMRERIEKADLVMACGTAGCVSVAMGQPTVFFSELGVPRSFPKDALHYDRYEHLIKFPCYVENMTIEEIMALRTAINPKIRHWRDQVLGVEFDPQKFIGVVREYVG